MKAIKNLIISLVVIVAILGVVIIGGYVYVRTTYGIDLFRTAGQLKTLTQAVDETALCPNAFGEEDFAEMNEFEARIYRLTQKIAPKIDNLQEMLSLIQLFQEVNAFKI